MILFRYTILAVLSLFLNDPPAKPGPREGSVVFPPRHIDVSRVSVAKTQKEIGKDVGKIFAFVRDEIRPDVYPGALRGEQGTLVSLAGNSLDKSLLFAGLLREAGYRTRFVRGRLKDQKASLLMQRVFQAPEITGLEKSNEGRISRFLDSILKDTESQGKWLKETLGKGGVVFPVEGGGSYKENLDLLKDHWWIQIQFEDKWIDYDPGFAGSKPGQTHSGSGEVQETIPGKQYHRVVFRIVIEELKGDHRKKRILFRHEEKSTLLAGQNIFLAHKEASWKKPLPSLFNLGETVKKMTGLLGGLGSPRKSDTRRIKPVLMFGNERFASGRPFEILRPAMEKAALASKKPVRVTGEWIEVEFHSPSGKVRTARRTIFDRLSLADRGKSSGHPAMGAIRNHHPEKQFFCLSFHTGPVWNRRALIGIQDQKVRSETQPGKKGETYLCTSTVLSNVNNAIALFASLSSFQVSDENGKNHRVVFGMNAPRLIISSTRSTGEGDELNVDLRFQSFRPLVSSPDLNRVLPYMNLFLGVYESHVEDGILSFLNGSDGPEEEGRPTGTASLFRKYREAGGTLLVLKRPGDEAPSDLSREIKTRIRADLEAGNLVAIPGKGVKIGDSPHIAWWRIDPRSGQTTGVTETGLHGATIRSIQTAPEYEAMVYDKQKKIYYFKKGKLIAGKTYTSEVKFLSDWAILRQKYMKGLIKLTVL